MLLSSRSSSRFDRLPNDDGRSSILLFDSWQYRSELRLPNDSGSSLSRFWPSQTVTATIHQREKKVIEPLLRTISVTSLQYDAQITILYQQQQRPFNGL